MVFAVRGFLLPNRLFYDQLNFFCSSQLEGKISILQLEGFAVRGVSTVLSYLHHVHTPPQMAMTHHFPTSPQPPIPSSSPLCVNSSEYINIILPLILTALPTSKAPIDCFCPWLVETRDWGGNDCCELEQQPQYETIVQQNKCIRKEQKEELQQVPQHLQCTMTPVTNHLLQPHMPA